MNIFVQNMLHIWIWCCYRHSTYRVMEWNVTRKGRLLPCSLWSANRPIWSISGLRFIPSLGTSLTHRQYKKNAPTYEKPIISEARKTHKPIKTCCHSPSRYESHCAPPPSFNAVVSGGYDGVHAGAAVGGGAAEALRCACGLRDIS